MKWLLALVCLWSRAVWAQEVETPPTRLEKGHAYMLCHFGVVGTGLSEIAAGTGLTYALKPYIVSPLRTWSGVYKVMKVFKRGELEALEASREVAVYLLRGIPPYTLAKVTLAIAADGLVYILTDGRYSVLGYLFGPSGKTRPMQIGDYWACSSY